MKIVFFDAEFNREAFKYLKEKKDVKKDAALAGIVSLLSVVVLYFLFDGTGKEIQFFMLWIVLGVLSFFVCV